MESSRDFTVRSDCGLTFGFFDATWTLGYIESGFGATTFHGEYVYTARGDLTLDFVSQNDGSASLVTLSQEGPECFRRQFTDTLYDASSGGFPPQDAIYTINAKQQPALTGTGGNAGGFARIVQSITIRTLNAIENAYLCLGCTNGTLLTLYGDPQRLHQGTMEMEVKTTTGGGKVQVFDGNTLLIDGSGTKTWTLSSTFRMNTVPSPLRVVGKTVSKNTNDVNILYKYLLPSGEQLTAASEKVTVLKVDIERIETNLCVHTPEASLKLTPDSYFAPEAGGTVIWTNIPDGLSNLNTTT